MGERYAAVESLAMNPRFWDGRRVLLTGHTGFKGSWLALWLASMGARVTGFALDPPTQPSLWDVVRAGAGIESMHADVLDRAALDVALARARPEIVFHLAAQSLVRTSYEDPVGTLATNVLGTAHLLDALRHRPGVRAAVIVTSDKCYENREWDWGYREHEPLGGRDPYSASKGCAELVTAAFRASFFAAGAGATAIASARAGNVIGGGDWAEGRIVPDVARALAAGETVRLRSPGAVRPWQHVLDPLAGYLRLAEALCEDPQRHAEAWNFGPLDTDAVSVRELVERMLRLWDPEGEIGIDAGEHPHEAHVLRLDSAKARTRLGWRPRLGLEQALAWTVEWYRAHADGRDLAALTRAQIGRYMEVAAR